MAVKSSILVFMLLVSVISLTVLALIGVYVYRDARRRGMNAVLWTLVAIVAPALIGFIIYLLVRGSYPDLECPQCAAPVTEQFVVCPQCGTKLRPACPRCSGPVEPDWKVCPRCAAPLDGVDMHPAPPLRRRDRTLGKILIAIILVPVALIVLAVLSFSAYSVHTGSGSLWELTFEEYDLSPTSEEARSAVHSWLDSLEIRGDRAYALQYSHYDELSAVYTHLYLFYIPSGGGASHSGFGGHTGLFGTILELEMDNTGLDGFLYAVEWQTTENQPPTPRITLGGRRIRCDVTVVDYNPTPYFAIPDYADAEFGNGQFLPERITVVKYVDNENVGSVVMTNPVRTDLPSTDPDSIQVNDPELMLKLLAAIDSAERVPMGSDQLPRFQLNDGFEIVVEYLVNDVPVLNEYMARHMVLMEDGVCWLQDSRVRNTTHGSSFRVMDGDFYELLGTLFETG